MHLFTHEAFKIHSVLRLLIALERLKMKLRAPFEKKENLILFSTVGHFLVLDQHSVQNLHLKCSVMCENSLTKNEFFKKPLALKGLRLSVEFHALD